MQSTDSQSHKNTWWRWSVHRPNFTRYGLAPDKVHMYLTHLLEWHNFADGSFLYAWKDVTNPQHSGTTLYNNVVNSQLYQRHIVDQELLLYAASAKKLRPYFYGAHNSIHFDLGPWESAQKFQHFISQLGLQNDTQAYTLLDGNSYRAIDIAPDYIASSREAILDTFRYHRLSYPVDKQWWKLDPATGLTSDFFYTDEFRKYNGSNFIYLLGGTMSNLSPDSIQKLLQNFKSNPGRLRNNNTLVFTYHHAPDKDDPDYIAKVQKLLAIYGDPDTNNPYHNKESHHHIQEWILGWLEALWLDINNYEFVVRYDDKHADYGSVKLGVKCLVKQEIQVEQPNGSMKTFYLLPGTYLWAIESRRYTTSSIETLCKQAWFIIQKHLGNDEESMGIICAKNTISLKTYLQAFWQQNGKNIRHATYYTMIGALLMAGVWSLFYTHKKHKQEEIFDVYKKKVLANKDMRVFGEWGERWMKNDELWPEKIMQRINDIHHNLMYIATDMYNLDQLPEDKKQLFSDLLKNYVIHNVPGQIFYSRMGFDNVEEIKYIQNFAISNEYTLVTQEILPTAIPYAYLLDYKEALKNSYDRASNNGDIGVPQYQKWHYGQYGPKFFKQGLKGSKQWYEELWWFQWTGTNRYRLALIKDDAGRPYIAALSSYDYSQKDDFLLPYDAANHYERKELLEKADKQYSVLEAKYAIREIFERWYTRILAEKLRDYIIKRRIIHNDKRLIPGTRNGIDEINAFLVDKNIQGHDFSYLVYAGDDVLDNFLNTYLLPEMGVRLQERLWVDIQLEQGNNQWEKLILLDHNTKALWRAFIDIKDPDYQLPYGAEKQFIARIKTMYDIYELWQKKLTPGECKKWLYDHENTLKNLWFSVVQPYFLRDDIRQSVQETLKPSKWDNNWVPWSSLTHSDDIRDPSFNNLVKIQEMFTIQDPSDKREYEVILYTYPGQRMQIAARTLYSSEELDALFIADLEKKWYRADYIEDLKKNGFYGLGKDYENIPAMTMISLQNVRDDFIKNHKYFRYSTGVTVAHILEQMYLDYQHNLSGI